MTDKLREIVKPRGAIGLLVLVAVTSFAAQSRLLFGWLSPYTIISVALVMWLVYHLTPTTEEHQ